MDHSERDTSRQAIRVGPSWKLGFSNAKPVRFKIVGSHCKTANAIDTLANIVIHISMEFLLFSAEKISRIGEVRGASPCSIDPAIRSPWMRSVLSATCLLLERYSGDSGRKKNSIKARANGIAPTINNMPFHPTSGIKLAATIPPTAAPRTNPKYVNDTIAARRRDGENSIEIAIAFGMTPPSPRPVNTRNMKSCSAFSTSGVANTHASNNRRQKSLSFCGPIDHPEGKEHRTCGDASKAVTEDYAEGRIVQTQISCSE